MTLKNAGMYQVSLYTALIKNMFRVLTYDNVKLKEYYGKKTVEILKKLNRINKFIWSHTGDHVFYVG